MIVLDSSFLIGFYNENDAHHPVASGAMERFLAGVWGSAAGLSFVDSALVVLARSNGVESILSFDRGFDAVPGLRRLPDPA